MSGDIQPRKRKDKRRKKEGSSIGGAVHEPVSFQKYKRSESDDIKVFDVPDQGEKIHVQNEHGVGGNICVKIIFFCLFGLLVGAVGLIYLKSLGSTDVDLPTIEESRFAEYFTGWLDDSHDDHEHETLENSLDQDHDDHDDEHGEHDDEEEHDHEDHDEDDEHEHEEEDQSPEQASLPNFSDSIYKLFGLQEENTDDVDDVEESEIKEKKVTENELGINENVDDDEDDVDDDDNDDQEDEEEEEEDDGDDDERSEMEDDEEEEEKEKSEMEEEESDAEDNENDDDDDKENDDEDDEENDEKDDEDEEDNESGIDLSEKVAEEDEEEDEDLSQVDEEDESTYKGSHLNKDAESSETKQSGEEEEEEEDDDDDDGVEQDGDENEENDETDEVEKEDKEDKVEDSKKTGKSKTKAESDDLGFEEIDVSEEDLEEEEEHKLKDKDDSEDSTEEKMEKPSTEEEEEEQDADEADTGGVALRLGVGIALIIVAHLVLVKKWRSMSSATVDENTTTGVESTFEKKEVENLHSSFEPVISRRQTLIPEDFRLNEEGEEEEEMEEEEDEDEEEEEEEDEEHEEETKEDDLQNNIHPEKPYVEEEIKKVKKDNWETFEKPSWNIRGKQFDDEDDEDVENEELGEEGEEEEGEEEVEDEEAEEAEEDDDEEIVEEEEEEEEEEGVEDEEEDEEDDVEDDNDFIKHKFHQTVPEDREEEIVTEAAPTPPPRTRGHRGAQEFQEFIDRFEEFNEIEEPIQESPKGDEPNNNSGPEEQKTPENKVGNEDEWAFRQEFDIAEEQFENNPKAAVETYEKIISKKPDLIRALIGHARALDHWAEKEKSNAHLKKAINSYKNVLLNQGHRLDEETYVKLAERCIERMRFAGALVSAIEIHKALILKYPNTPKYRNMLAVTYLMLNKIPQARVLLNETLSLWPGNGFALVHYGFILKTSDNNMEEGAKKLMAGIQTREEGVIDGMFFFHLGDALNRLGRAKEAMEWYELGVKEGLFLSKYQRSLYNVNRLKGQPWWTKKETTYQDFFKKLEDNWREIRREGLELLNSKGVNLFKEEAENLKDTGDWKQLDLYFRGRKQANCNKAPITCSLVSSFKPASSCTRGQIKFSVMLPNTHVWPHCGPTNCRLRSHLGLVVPKGTFIRVAEETRSWEEGKFIIFDDSFEHEVWHNGTGPRLVLIVDVWHPELTSQERRSLSPI